MEWVRAFNPYDLYSKGHEPPDVKALRPYYEDLIAEFFPAEIGVVTGDRLDSGMQDLRVDPQMNADHRRWRAGIGISDVT